MQLITRDASWLALQPSSVREAFLASLTTQEAQALEWDWWFWSRPAQRPPDGDWTTWLICAGRGFGKTKAGAEWVRWQIETQGKRRIALIGATAADTRDVMVGGESGLLAVCPSWNKPRYEPSKRRVIWPNGAIATLYSADQPERLRGPQHDAGWLDEVGAWRYQEEAWSMYQFGLRLGTHPRTVVTTTPRPTPLIRQLLQGAYGTAVTRGTTYENRANLAPAFFASIIKAHEHTRLGRQELLAELLADAPGALWKREQLDTLRVMEHPDLKRILVGMDPSVTSGEESAETGIIVVGRGEDDHGYVLEDCSLRDRPHQTCRAAIAAYHRHGANAIVVEVNNGGDYIPDTIHAIDPNVRVGTVRATRGKYTRAEPVATLYEQGRAHHVGFFGPLEDQQCQWMPGEKSPDRLDALVWAFTALFDLRTVVPLHDEPLATAAAPIPNLTELMRSDPFDWIDQHGGWD